MTRSDRLFTVFIMLPLLVWLGYVTAAFLKF